MKMASSPLLVTVFSVLIINIVVMIISSDVADARRELIQKSWLIVSNLICSLYLLIISFNFTMDDALATYALPACRCEGGNDVDVWLKRETLRCQD